MRKWKETSRDPNKRERIENTRVAQWAAYLLIGSFTVLLVGVLEGLVPGLFMGLAMWFFGVLIFGSRHQHQHRRRRRKRILRSKEHPHVPDTAISRAQPPGEPEPTDAALSIAGSADEPGHLTISIEDTTEVVVDDRP